MRRLASLLVLSCLSCGRDLTLPPQAQPPRIDSVSPAQGFAGDQITITGANLADPAAQVFFDVRAAVILTPTDQRDGKSLLVEVPQNVLGTGVSVTTGQGTGKAAQDFSYLGLGHPRTVALRATLSISPDVEEVVPLPGGDVYAVLDHRYGTVRALDSQRALGAPAYVGRRPVLAFGPAANTWIVDDPLAGAPGLQQIDLTQDPPALGPHLALPSEPSGGDGSPSGARFALPVDSTVVLYTLPAGTTQVIDLGVSDAVLAVRFWGEDTIVGVTAGQPFRIDLSGASPQVTPGAEFPSTALPDFRPVMAIDAPPSGQLVYSSRSNDTVQRLTWTGAAAPALAAQAIHPRLLVALLSFNQDGSKVMVGDTIDGIVAQCDPGTGEVESAQELPGVASLRVVHEGGDAGYLLAAVGGGTALLFPDGRLLRRDAMGASINGMAVDPVCADVLLGSEYGPIRISADTLTPGLVKPAPHLDSVQSSEGGVAGFAGNELYAYQPAAGCKTAGNFVHIATSPDAVIETALSGDGKWVAAASLDALDLLPRGDAGSAQRVQFDRPEHVEAAFAASQLTAIHPIPGDGFAVSSYQPGTLTETASLALADPPRSLQRVRFAQAWIMNQNSFDAGNNFIGTHVTVWSAEAGKLTEADVPASVTVPSGISADGFMLIGLSTVGIQSGLDTVLLEVTGGRLLQESGPHVDLSSDPSEVASSPDGGRLYVLLPDISSVAVVE